VTEFNDTVSEEAKILAITKLFSFSWSKIATRILRPLRVISFNRFAFVMMIHSVLYEVGT
jgi:hypothetical protein